MAAIAADTAAMMSKEKLQSAGWFAPPCWRIRRPRRRRGDPGDRARALARPALADLPDQGSAAARAEDLRLSATYRRIEACLASAAPPNCCRNCGSWSPSIRYCEPFRAQLIRAACDGARPRRRPGRPRGHPPGLAERLGTDPGPELAAPCTRNCSPRNRERRRPPCATARRTGNLRARLTSFVGREAETRQAAVRAGRRAAHRLVTLAGPGGSGTAPGWPCRPLSRRAPVPRAFPDSGVWLAELAPLDRRLRACRTRC